MDPTSTIKRASALCASTLGDQHHTVTKAGGAGGGGGGEGGRLTCLFKDRAPVGKRHKWRCLRDGVGSV